MPLSGNFYWVNKAYEYIKKQPYPRFIIIEKEAVVMTASFSII